MDTAKCDKMIIAILQNDDYRDVVENLNGHGFYVTVLRSSGGFMKKPSATILIGLNHEDLDKAVSLLKYYGKRLEKQYKPSTANMGMPVSPLAMPSVPVTVDCGGIVIFVLDVEQMEKY